VVAIQPEPPTHRLVLERAAAAQRAPLENLFQLYVHDFSEFWRPGQGADIGDDGRFPPYPPLEAYWNEAGREARFIRSAGALAGFALLNAHSHSGIACDWNVGEFFVARPYRGSGIGSLVLRQLIADHSGRWEVAIAERNLPAQAFWPRAIRAAGIETIEQIEGDGAQWAGPLLRFTAPG
jgi:predicted acetyltransferase